MDVALALNRFAEALNDGKIDSTDSFTAVGLSTAVKAVVETTDSLDGATQNSLNNQTAQLDAAGDSFEASYDEDLDLDEGATQADKIAAFQAFVTQFRSWAGSIDETAAALQDETSAVSVALDVDVETVSDVFSQAGVTGVTGDLVSKVVDAFAQQLTGPEGRAALLDALENGSDFTAEQSWTDEMDQTATGTMDATLVFEDTESGLQATASGSVSQTDGETRSFDLVTYLDFNDTTAAFNFDVNRADVLQFVDYDETAQDFQFGIYPSDHCYDYESGMDVHGERIAYADWYDSQQGVWNGNCNVLDDAENAALDQLVMGKLGSVVGDAIAAESAIENVWVEGDSTSVLAEVNTDIAFPSLETTENFVDLSFNIAAGVSLVDMPKATAVVTLTRSTLNGGSALANVSWENGSYSLNVSTDDLNAEYPQVSLAFWNAQWFRLEAVGKETAAGVQSLAGNVFINGEDIGDVTLRNGIPVVTYPNGDTTEFETLF